MEWPIVAVMLFTYAPDTPDGRKRATTARRTLRSLRRLDYSGHLHLHIADDGSELKGHVESLAAMTCDTDWTLSIRNSERGGYGASYNLATQAVHDFADVLLPLEDDWELGQRFDLDPLVRTLMLPPPDDGDGFPRPLRCLRLGYLGQTKPLLGDVVVRACGKVLWLNPDGEERHIFAGGPRLETRAYQRDIGPWPEGGAAGWTEFEVAGRPQSRQGVGWPLDYGPASQSATSLFRHIGSVGLGELQP